MTLRTGTGSLAMFAQLSCNLLNSDCGELRGLSLQARHFCRHGACVRMVLLDQPAKKARHRPLDR